MTDSDSMGAGASSVEMSGYSTYHCVCTELVAAVPQHLHGLPKRQQDGTFICELGRREGTTTVGIAVDEKATILKLDDGFEKRYPARCTRCGLMVAYFLDQSQFDGSREASGPFEGALYVLPGSLLTTEEMAAGKDAGKDSQMVKSVMA